MDKYEYQVCADQIKSLIKDHRFQEAMDIADTIDWRRVKSFSMLCTVSEIYKVTKHYSEARDILLLAYERYPDRANVVYALCELAVKLDEISEAIEYYREYVHLKPHDTNRYVLLYKIYEAQDVPLEEKISLLEEFKRAEYTEKWAYELALLYHKDGQETKCVETCDELALWFGEGPYVRKALELKMQHSPLTKEQQQKYDGVYDAPKIPTGETEETVHIYETQSMPIYAKGASPYETAPMDKGTGSLLDFSKSPVAPPQPVVQPQADLQENVGKTADIQIAPYSNDKYSTMNLQEELARNMEEFYAKENNVVVSPYYGVTSQLYDQSQEQFMQQLNQAGPVQQEVQPQAGQGAFEQVRQPMFETQPIYGQQMQQMPQQGVYAQQGQVQQAMYEQPVQMEAVPQAMYEQQMPGQGVYGQQGQVQQAMYEQPVQMEAVPQAMYEQQMPRQMYEQAAQMEAVPQPMYEQVTQMEAVQPQQMYEQPVQMEAAQPQPMYEQAAQMEAVPQPMYEQATQVETVPQQPTYGQPVVQTETAQTVDDQVPGQIDLSDFMKDWETKKKNGEEQRKQQILNRSKEQTQDIMSQLVGVIPGIEETVMPDPEEKAPAAPEDVPAEDKLKEEVIKEDKKGVVTRTTIPSPVFEREGVKRTESGARINGPVKASITGIIPDVLPDADMPIKGDVLPSGRKLTLDEEYGGDIARIRKEDVELVKRLTGELPEPEETIESTPVTPPPEDYGEAEEIEEVEQPYLPEDEDDAADTEETAAEPVAASAAAIASSPVTVPAGMPVSAPAASAGAPVMPAPVPVSVPTVSAGAPVMPASIPAAGAEAKTDEKPVIRHGLTAPIQYPYSVDDLGEVEELETIDQPDEVDDMLKTRPIPQEEIEARMRYEAGIEEEYSGEEEARKANHPSWMKLEENVTSRRDFDESETAIFGRFEGIESLKAQIVDVIDDMKMEAGRGNVIVMGSENFGRKSLAIDIVKAIQAMDSTFSGKVAKISGEALNKKNIPMTLQKLSNGALIVENAGGLTPITLNAITETLQNDVESILVVFEGEKDSLEPLLNGCPETKTVFDARIVIDDFSNSDLVAYAKGYARELEYSIDDMGTLALYNKIGDMQTIDHVVTVDEVIEIVDSAIRHVDRKNMSHFMDVLLAKRYDDDDYIVLREKDFLN
ncbi:MAG: hypothetical protein K6F28_01770 [Lachnospiraceae bacterium]|nr:hypothetical protein [Lachnospiraceae bacterium]